MAITVSKIAASIAASSAPNPSFVGQPVTLSAQVSPASATGTVQFLGNGVVLGIATVANGSASVTTTALPLGSTSITASYSGDPFRTAATSPVSAQTVTKLPTSTTLTSSQNPSVRGHAVTLTAAISSLSATGSVQFFDGTALLGTVMVSSSKAFLTFVPTLGTHSITAVYSGDSTFAGSTSPVLTQVVNNH